MTPCFADAYYFFALLNPRDEAHAAAVEINRQLRRPLVTSAFILLEVADGLAGTPSRALFGRLRERLSGDQKGRPRYYRPAPRALDTCPIQGMGCTR